MKKTIILTCLVCLPLFASAELVQQFKDPTFSGNGWASQQLTIIQMEQSAKATLESKKAAEASAAAAAAASTPLAQFMSLFTSQVYSQLATQLTNNLFCTAGQAGCTPSATGSGSFNVSPTEQIQWHKQDGNVVLDVFKGITNSSGVFNLTSTTPTQSITVPISSFAF